MNSASIIHFSDLKPDPIYGGKAAKLAELYQAGFNIPEGYVLSGSGIGLFLDANPKLKKAYQSYLIENSEANLVKIKESLHDLFFPQELENELEVIFNKSVNQGILSFAVRSSGSLEDGNFHSFAGQFESFLNVKSFEELKNSIINCWTSIFGNKVIAYCNNNAISIGDFTMNIVIQKQVHSEFSGVVFTVNPLTGSDKLMVIELVEGIGEALVQGDIDPIVYHYNWYHDKLELVKTENQNRKLTVSENASGLVWVNTKDSKQISTTKIIELGEICLEIQQFYGEPMDIEFAIANDIVYILQARPLTSIHFKVDYEWTTADLKDGGISSSITTPMMFSLYEYIFENTMPRYLKSILILPKRKFNKWFNWWFGYSYWNMLAVKEGVKQIPRFNERNFDKSLGIEPDYEGDGHVTKFTLKSILKGILVLIATKNSISKRAKKCKSIINTAKIYFDQVERFLNDKNSLEDQVQFFNDMIYNHYYNIEGGYFYAIYDNSNAATFCQESIDKANKKRNDKINYLHLVAGLSNLSHMRPTTELFELANKIKNSDLAFKYYSQITSEILSDTISKGNDFPMKEAVLKFINKYKYHSIRELDLQVANWDEDPKQVLNLLIEFVKNETIQNPGFLNKKQNELFQDEFQKLNSGSLRKTLNMHRHLLWWREEMRDYSSKMYYYIRRILLLIGHTMMDYGYLKSENDVFFLKFDELIDFGLRGDIEKYQNLISKNRIFYKSYRNFSNPNEIWQKKDFFSRELSLLKTEKTFHGTAGAQGYIIAKAVVIQSIFETDKILDGCILITKSTDPAWTIYFSRISGLITESGGILSHGAVVSREYGIPAVLGISGITKLIKSGDMVEIDGEKGVVNVLNND